MHKMAVEDFKRSEVWQDIVQVLGDVKVGLIEDLKDLDPFEQPGKLAQKQGRLAMIEFVLAQPDAIMAEIEIELKDKERKEGNGRRD